MPDPDEIAEGALHRALQGWPTDRAQHMADLAVITDQVVAEGGPLGSPTVFAVLRDIADTEPVAHEYGKRCAMCGVHIHSETDPLPHLISCPWLQATKIVGVAADAGSRLYPDVELSTDGGRTWSPFPVAVMAPLRRTVSDGQVHDDGRGHLYRAVGSAGDPTAPVVHRSVPKGGPRHG